MPNLVSVNGRVTRLERGRVAVLDRGFLLADGVYEVMRTYGGRVFLLDAHLQRLFASLHGARIEPPRTRRALADLIARLLRRSGHAEARIYVQVTRGVAPRQHAFPRGARPTLVVWVEKIAPADGRPASGVRVITVPDRRWGHCDMKSIGLLANVLAKQQAVDAGAHDAVFVGPRGQVREASTANVFAVRDRAVYTHPLGPEILPGVSRAVVLSLAREAGLRVVERALHRRALYAADEVFLSSTMQEVLPVVAVDGRRIGSGRAGPVTRELHSRFRARTRAAVAGADRGRVGRRGRGAAEKR